MHRIVLLAVGLSLFLACHIIRRVDHQDAVDSAASFEAVMLLTATEIAAGNESEPQATFACLGSSAGFTVDAVTIDATALGKPFTGKAKRTPAYEVEVAAEYPALNWQCFAAKPRSFSKPDGGSATFSITAPSGSLGTELRWLFGVGDAAGIMASDRFDTQTTNITVGMGWMADLEAKLKTEPVVLETDFGALMVNDREVAELLAGASGGNYNAIYLPEDGALNGFQQKARRASIMAGLKYTSGIAKTPPEYEALLAGLQAGSLSTEQTELYRSFMLAPENDMRSTPLGAAIYLLGARASTPQDRTRIAADCATFCVTREAVTLTHGYAAMDEGRTPQAKRKLCEMAWNNAPDARLLGEVATICPELQPALSPAHVRAADLRGDTVGTPELRALAKALSAGNDALNNGDASVHAAIADDQLVGAAKTIELGKLGLTEMGTEILFYGAWAAMVRGDTDLAQTFFRGCADQSYGEWLRVECGRWVKNLEPSTVDDPAAIVVAANMAQASLGENDKPALASAEQAKTWRGVLEPALGKHYAAEWGWEFLTLLHWKTGEQASARELAWTCALNCKTPPARRTAAWLMASFSETLEQTMTQQECDHLVLLTAGDPKKNDVMRVCEASISGYTPKPAADATMGRAFSIAKEKGVDLDPRIATTAADYAIWALEAGVMTKEASAIAIRTADVLKRDGQGPLSRKLLVTCAKSCDTATSRARACTFGPQLWSFIGADPEFAEACGLEE